MFLFLWRTHFLDGFRLRFGLFTRFTEKSIIIFFIVEQSLFARSWFLFCLMEVSSFFNSHLLFRYCRCIFYWLRLFYRYYNNFWLFWLDWLGLFHRFDDNFWLFRLYWLGLNLRSRLNSLFDCNLRFFFYLFLSCWNLG